MLSRLAFDGYRSFPARRLFDQKQPLQTIDLAPLTLVIGRNNAGKTSALSLLHASIYAIAGDESSPVPLIMGGRRIADHFADLLPARDTLSAMEWHLTLTASDTHHELGAVLFLEDNLNRAAGPTARSLSWDGQSFPVPTGPIVGSLLPEGIADRENWRAKARALLAESVWLGPLRESVPEIPNSARRTGEPPVGPAGEGVSALLANNEALFGAVAAWFREHANLRLRWEINLDQRRLMARRGRALAEVPITHTGDGIHQVLPVVTLALLRKLGERGAFLDLVQQPELHLHDALHPALGDLFINATENGQGVMVVETHAEGLLLRVRRRIAERTLDPQKVALIYVDDAPEGSSVRQIPIGEDGEVQSWPDGVFLERYEEVKAIRRAQRAQQ